MTAPSHGLVIEVDDPRHPEITALLERHLAFNRATAPPEDVHALDVDGLCAPEVTFFSMRRAGELIGVGALKQLDPTHAELKSMHTVERHRRNGAGRVMLHHLVETARARGCVRVSLETGSMEAFAPARALYATYGFEECGPFGDYRPSVNSTFMTLVL